MEPINANKQEIVQSKYKMIEMDDAFQIIKETIQSFEPKIELIDLRFAEDCIIAEDILSPMNVPKCNTSIMDGYAFNSEKSDFSKQFKVIDYIYAGSLPKTKNKPDDNESNTCIYVTTGSPVPYPFDLVIPIEYIIHNNQENNELSQSNIEINSKLMNSLSSNATNKLFSQFNFIRKTGSDIKENETLLKKYQKLDMNNIALINSVGIRQIKIFKRPVIGLLSTGDEITDIFENELNLENLKDSNVIDSNKLLLKNLIKNSFKNIKIVDYGILNDNYNETKRKIEEISKECDFLISSGGVSMGKKDYIKQIFENEGKILFGRLNMKPGKPTTFALFNNMLCFGLPGNPVSCYVTAQLLLIWAINIFQNNNQFEFSKLKASLLQECVILDDERPEYARVVLLFNSDDCKLYCYTTGNQLSSRILSMVNSNALALFPKANNENKGKLDYLANVDCILTSNNITTVNNKQLEEIRTKLNENKNYLSHSHQCVHEFNKHFNENKEIIKIKVAFLVISDRTFHKDYEKDLRSEALFNYFKEKNSEFEIINHLIVSDSEKDIIERINQIIVSSPDLILTCGGTGLTERDNTSQIIASLVTKRATGLENLLLTESIKITKFAALSNPVVGVIGRNKKSLIITLPGNPKAVKENLDIIFPVLKHAISQINK